jgi:hypothetical protein
LGSNDTAIAEGVAQKLEVGLLEEALGRALGVRGVGDDNVELVLLGLEELEAVADVGGDFGVLVADAHAGEILLGEADDRFVDVAQNSLLNGLVLDNLTEDTAIATTDDEDLLGVRVRVHGEVGDHLLVGEFVALGALDDIVEDENVAVVAALENEDVLVLGLLVVQDLVDLEAHCLAGPHVGALREPAI